MKNSARAPLFKCFDFNEVVEILSSYKILGLLKGLPLNASRHYGLGGLAASKTAEHQDFKVLKSLFLDNKCLFDLNDMKNKPLNLGFLLILGHVADARERCPLRI